jgi:hypothetical protein
VLLEGLGQLKNPVTSSGIEPATFRYRVLPGKTVTNKNYIYEEIKSRLNSGNAFLPFGSESSAFLSDV